MLDLIKVAIRNVGRNKRRTVITIITVFIGVVVVTGTRGLLNGLQGEIRQGLTRKVHGDLQIHRRGYQDSLDSNPYKILIPFDESTIRTLKNVPGIESFTPRLRVMALLNHQKSQTSTPVMISGIDSQAELAVCPRMIQAVQKGQMLDSSREQSTVTQVDENLEEAVGLDEQTGGAVAATASDVKARGYHQIMVTPSLQRGMGAEIGDEIVLLIQDKNNMQQAVVATLVGVVDYGLPNVSARMAWMDFKTLQDTVGTRGEVSEIAVRTKPNIPEDLVRRDLMAVTPPDQIVETWLELGSFFRDVMNTQNAIFSVILMIVFVIVISAIVNTSLMTVMERTREIGTLMALGYRRNHILTLFLGEAAVIGFGGGISGLVFVTLALKGLSIHGINMTIPGAAIPTILYPGVNPSFLGLVLWLAIKAALVAGIIPAWRASRMKPVDALTTA